MEWHTKGPERDTPGEDSTPPYVGRAARATRRRARVAILSAVAVAAGLSAVPRSMPVSSHAYEPGGRFSCRASLARVGPVAATGASVEPVVANAHGDPCVSEQAGVANETTVVDVPPAVRLRVEALAADTVADPRASAAANSTAAHLDLMVGTVVVKASMVSAHARVACPGPALTSESTVLNLTVDGVGIDVPTGQAHTHVALPGIGTLHLNEEISAGDQVTRRAVWVEALPGGVVGGAAGDVVVGEAVAGFADAPCDVVTLRTGFMTGSGSTKDGAVHGVRLACGDSAGPSNLQVESGKMHFHLEAVTAVRCTDQPRISPGAPGAPFDTVEGSGTGRCNGGVATATWKLTDAGEPGRNDTLSITVSGSCSFSTAGALRQGNHQAHGTT